MAPDAIENRREFAQALTALRLQSGLTVRELARRLGTPTATVGDYFSGRHLPGPAQVSLFKALLGECGVEEPSVGEWVDALSRVRRTTDGRVARGPAPYRGLEPFGIEDAGLFFGREAATAELIARLGEALRAPDSEVAWPLIVVGPSGSGKSSLLRAGLASGVGAGALDGGQPWQVTVLTPEECSSESLAAFATTASGGPHLVVVDQLEEVFAFPAQERELFLAGLAGLRPPHAVVVAALRADFYGAASAEATLLPALRGSQVLIGAMNSDEVRAAIVEPARSVGTEVEPALVELLIADLAPAGESLANAAGALPLLSHALLATWTRARHNRLTVSAYKAAGGLHGAVAQSAENLYSKLSAPEQALARQMFCRLVRVDDDGPFTRRRVALRELAELAAAGREAGADAADEAAPAHPGLLDRFVAGRLLTAGSGVVELSHEALISAWPRLTEWLARDRAGLRMHRQLTQAANVWADADRDEALLLHGPRLQAITEWALEPGQRVELNDTEQQFFEASSRRAQAERAAERRRRRRGQQLAGLIAALALAAIVFAVLALVARQSAIHARDQALSRQVAVEASDLAGADPGLAMQLAAAAFRISPTTEATSALLDASAAEMPTRILGPIGPTLLASDGSGGVFAVVASSSARARIYRPDTGTAAPRLLGTLTGITDADAVAFDASGRVLAMGNAAGRVTLWSLAHPARPVEIARLHVRGGAEALAFSLNGSRLAAATGAGAVAQWSLSPDAAPDALPSLTVPGRPSLAAVTYSPSGRALATVGAGGALAVWKLAARPALLARVTVAATQMTTVAYSPDGSTLVAGAHDLTLWHWGVGSNGAPTTPAQALHGFANWIDSLAFSHDGRYLAAGSSDNTVRIWQTGTWSQTATFTDVSPVTGIAFVAGDRTLATVDENGTTRLWPFPPPTSDQTVGPAYTIDYTSDGDELAAVTGGARGRVEIWDTRNAWQPYRVASITMPPAFGPVAAVGAMTPDGKLLAVGNAKADVQEYALDGSGHAQPVGPLLTGAHPAIEQINFSPSGTLLSIGDDSGQVHLYDVREPGRPRLLSVIDRTGASSNVFGVSYSPNGRLMAIGCNDHKVWLWNISDPGRPRLLAVLGGFGAAVYSTAISPDGRTLIAGGADDTVRLWDITTPSHPRPLGPPLTGPADNVYQVGVSPDGGTLAAATTGGEVWLWSLGDRSSPRLIATLHAAHGLLYDLTFSPDGRTLVVGSSTQTMTFWHYRPSQVSSRICRLAGSPLTRAEWARYIPGAPYVLPCSRA